MARKSEKPKDEQELPATLQISGLSEFYFDQLVLAAWIEGHSLRAEAQNLLQAMLYAKLEARKSLLAELARKRNISMNELIDDILTGEAKPLSPAQYAASKIIKEGPGQCA